MDKLFGWISKRDKALARIGAMVVGAAVAFGWIYEHFFSAPSDTTLLKSIAIESETYALQLQVPACTLTKTMGNFILTGHTNQKLLGLDAAEREFEAPSKAIADYYKARMNDLTNHTSTAANQATVILGALSSASSVLSGAMDSATSAVGVFGVDRQNDMKDAVRQAFSALSLASTLLVDDRRFPDCFISGDRVQLVAAIAALQPSVDATVSSALSSAPHAGSNQPAIEASVHHRVDQASHNLKDIVVAPQ